MRSPLIEGDLNLIQDGQLALKEIDAGRNPGDGSQTGDMKMLKMDIESDGFGFVLPVESTTTGADLIENFRSTEVYY
jgi:hypothetical protein